MTKKFDARNAEKSRAVCEAMAERADTGKRVLTERERRILDMWPRFEDGEPVWFEDAVEARHGGAITIEAIEFSRGKVCVKDAEDGDWDTSMYAMRPLKRPAPEVLDADGVEIKVGDTVWYRSLCTMGSMRKAMVTGFDENCLGGKLATLKDEAGKTWYIDPKKITHVQPDSWERFVEDMQKSACTYFGYQHKECGEGDGCPASGALDCSNRKMADLIRRAKALAGAEAGR